MVYKTDAPLNIRSLFYVPTNSPELHGFGKLENGVSLYSRKVLIQAKAENILPGWLRFMKGVVDSEDIPLNLSRELLQDSALIKKLSSVISSKLTRFFQDQMKKDYVKYEKFFKDFGIFIREGVVSAETQEEREDIAKLLRFESSKEKSGVQKTITQYVKDMKPGQKDIFYLCIPRFVQFVPTNWALFMWPLLRSCSLDRLVFCIFVHIPFVNNEACTGCPKTILPYLCGC